MAPDEVPSWVRRFVVPANNGEAASANRQTTAGQTTGASNFSRICCLGDEQPPQPNRLKKYLRVRWLKDPEEKDAGDGGG